MEKGQADNITRKGGKKSKITKILIVIFLIAFLFIGIIIGIYNFRNYKLYKYITSSSEEEIDIYYNFKYMLIWNKTIEYIKENKKEVNFIGKNYTISIPSYNFSKYYDFNIYIYDEISTNEKFKNLRVCIVDFTDFQDRYGVGNIKLKLSDNMRENKILDVYKFENDETILYKKALDVKDGYINFNIEDDTCNKYIIVNVPLEDIIIENEVLEIKNNTSLDLITKTYPDNATVSNFNFKSNSEALSISSDGIINAKEAGEYVIEISEDITNIKKEITIRVIPVALEIRPDKQNVEIGIGKNTKINVSVYPEDAINKELVFESLDENIVTVDNEGNLHGNNIGECDIIIKTKEKPIVETNIKIKVVEIPQIVDNNAGLTYINGVLIANKKYSLPATYNPGIDKTALSAYYEMKNDAVSSGFSLEIMSGFRSYDTQRGLYNRYVNTYGKAEADTFSAEPGKSEHQTGLAFDLGWVDDDYAYTAEGKWLEKNCYKYGFIIRYPKGKEHITGYKYEPWHVRYLGNPLATDVYNSGLCLEEYLGI